MAKADFVMYFEGRAAEVAEWLRNVFITHPTWILSELEMAANARGIDLVAWLEHPAIRAEMDLFGHRPEGCQKLFLVATAACDEEEDDEVPVPAEAATELLVDD